MGHISAYRNSSKPIYVAAIQSAYSAGVASSLSHTSNGDVLSYKPYHEVIFAKDTNQKVSMVLIYS
jgi:hypothetical protein